ncbi:MAG: YhbY family RNA-binding protein [Gammaproteobacteria bacterium]|nr:YhbY family RNA-binding protein [Gammaproteobacteria bacterium]MCP5201799.1 YhbY family RNA-binding protein [Gammaproteobacteria bacterium]
MLTPAAKRKLKQSAHHLKPVVLVGQHGLTAAVMAEIDRALTDHELIKVHFRGMERDERGQEIARAAAALAADVVSTIGGMAVLYRENPDKAQPRGRA